MRKQGLDAYPFRGGTSALKQWAERSGISGGPGRVRT
jgi:hypothetical protein